MHARQNGYNSNGFKIVDKILGQNMQNKSLIDQHLWKRCSESEIYF
jgi:hypothetical protein